MDNSTRIFLPKTRGCNVNALDEEQQTPLHKAADQGHASAVKYLLENGADMELKDEDGNQPIHLAASGGHFEYVYKALSISSHCQVFVQGY